MKDLFRQILSLLLISSLLIGVLGINLHHHICGSTGNHYVSLEKSDSHCSNYNDCCATDHNESENCCKQDINEKNNENNETHSKCKDYVQTLKLKIQTITDNAKKLINTAVKVFVLIFTLQSEDHEDNDYQRISSKQKVIKQPIKEIISYIHFSARSAYAA